MNSRARPTAAPARTAAATLAVVAMAGAAGLAGCADVHRALETPRVNPESPVAAQVAAGADRSYPTPLLRDVPPVPRNLPQPDAVKGEVTGLVVCRRAMEGWVIDHPPLSGQPAAFAADARELAEVTPADIPPPDAAAQAEAFAAQLRQEGAPPPAIGAGPAPRPQDASPPVAGASRPDPMTSAIAKAGPAASQAPAVAPPPPVTAPAADLAPTAVAAAPSLPPPQADPLLGRCS